MTISQFLKFAYLREISRNNNFRKNHEEKPKKTEKNQILRYFKLNESTLVRKKTLNFYFRNISGKFGGTLSVAGSVRFSA